MQSSCVHMGKSMETSILDSVFFNGPRAHVNQNDAFLQTCAKNEHAYHTPTGELTKWMDNAFASKMKVPFYGKHPHEMNR